MKSLTSLILLFCCFPIYSQNYISRHWAFDDISVTVNDMARAADGSYYFTAWATTDATESTYAMVIKADTMLNIEWVKRYKSLQKDVFDCITPNAQGDDFYLGGGIRQDFSLHTGASFYKIHGSGLVSTHVQYDGSYDDRTIGIFHQPGNTYMVFIRNGVVNQPGKILQVFSSGEIIHQKELYFYQNIGASFSDVCTDNSNNYYVTGTVSDSILGYKMLYVASLTNTTVNWIKQYDPGRAIRGIKIVPGTDDSVLILGSISDEDPEVNFEFPFVMSINHNGTMQYTSALISGFEGLNFQGIALAASTDGGVYVAGSQTTDSGALRGYILKMNSLGNLEWSKAFTDGISQFPNIIYPIDNQHILVSANSLYEGVLVNVLNAGGESNCPPTDANISTEPVSIESHPYPYTESTLAMDTIHPTYHVSSIDYTDTLFCSGTLGIHQTNQDSYFRIYPNPSAGKFRIDYRGTSKVATVSVWDIFGNRVFSSESFLANTLPEINLETLPAGIYLFEIATDSGYLSQKVLKY